MHFFSSNFFYILFAIHIDAIDRTRNKFQLKPCIYLCSFKCIFFLSSRIVCFDDTHLSTVREKKSQKSHCNQYTRSNKNCVVSKEKIKIKMKNDT